jgi:hypothetical protein
MRKITLLFFTILFSNATCYAQNYVWAKNIGGSGSDLGAAIAIDRVGSIYATGTFSGTVDFDPGMATTLLTSAGQNDIFVLKLDASGNLLWAKGMGGTSTEYATSITVDDLGNVYSTGWFTGTADFDPSAGTSTLTSSGSLDVFVTKLDSSGHLLWAKSMGGTSAERAMSVTVDSFGNVYTTGWFEGIADFDPGAGTSNLSSVGSADVFISKLDPLGNFIWAKNIGGASAERAMSVTVDDFGYVYTTGWFGGTADFDPGAGTSNLSSVGSADVFISKLDPSGNFIWAKNMGGTGTSSVFGTAMALDGSNIVYTTGFFQGTVDFDPGAGLNNLTSEGSRDIFISKLDSAGNFIWAKSIGGTNYAESHSVAVDGFGNVYTTGYFHGTADFDPGTGTRSLTSEGAHDVFISKLDALGHFIWAKSLGGTGTSGDGGSSVAVDHSGNVYTTGEFQGTVDFDPGAGTSNLASEGDLDIFISKLGPSKVGFLENSFEKHLRAYPNPIKDALSIDLGKSYNDVTVIIRNKLGQDVLKESYSVINLLQLRIPGETGIYFIEVSSSDKKAILKVMKE